MSTSKNDLFLKPIYVLDGGFSTQLSKYDDNHENHPLWSSFLLYKNPKLIYQTHLDYLRAGAEIIETNTYQASIAGFQKYLEESLTEQQCRDLISKAVQIAKDARDIYLTELKSKACMIATDSVEPDELNEQIYIAGCVGPFGAYLHDGSEYTGDYVNKFGIKEIRDWHIPRIESLLTGGVDLLAFETIPVSQEAEMLCELLKNYPRAKAWLSFSCKDGKCLNSGENFQSVAKKCLELNSDQIIAIGVNCCKPEFVEELLKDFNKDRKGHEIPFIVYPNSGETYNKEKGWIDKDKCIPFEIYAKSWIKLGVKFIGGCCRTDADTIRKLREMVTKYIDKLQHAKTVQE